MRTLISGVALAFMLATAGHAQQSPAPDSTPMAEPAAPEPKPEPPVVEEQPRPVFDVVEPKAPAPAKPKPKSKATAKPAAQPVAREDMLRAEVLKPNGACVIKPVMSDQDLVNCGARVR